MKKIMSSLVVLVAMAIVGLTSTPVRAQFARTSNEVEGADLAKGIVSKVQEPGMDYCFIRFLAIDRNTLFTDHPQLTDPSEKDIIQYYGPCDFDPLGKEAIHINWGNWWDETESRN